MKWLLCVSDHIVEMTLTWQTFRDGTNLRISSGFVKADLEGQTDPDRADILWEASSVMKLVVTVLQQCCLECLVNPTGKHDCYIPLRLVSAFPNIHVVTDHMKLRLGWFVAMAQVRVDVFMDRVRIDSLFLVWLWEGSEFYIPPLVTAPRRVRLEDDEILDGLENSGGEREKEEKVFNRSLRF
ncbi:hypothetical protein F2Q70_00005152 [Brassica cretica]|uniref:Uncharacterized protein n=1 Tax=Brassica cretica TaxID=69181 RepID=A0A8S9IVD0_BRACR|nr:hypothetical protein F2Q70_00005152 [Brassica cretica]